MTETIEIVDTPDDRPYKVWSLKEHPTGPWDKDLFLGALEDGAEAIEFARSSVFRNPSRQFVIYFFDKLGVESVFRVHG